MGAKKSVKRPRKWAKQQGAGPLGDSWLAGVDSAAPAKPKPGKRTLSDDQLVGDRDPWAHLLESFWGLVGWELKCARTPEDIYRAFLPLALKSYEHRLAPFVRPTSEATTSKSLRATKKEYIAATSRLGEIEKRQSAQAESVRQAEGAVWELSDQNQQQLQSEIGRRKENLRDIGIRRSNKKGEIRKAETALKRAKPRDRESLGRELSSRKAELERIETQYAEEQKILGQVNDRLGAITPERREPAAEILKRRKTAMSVLDQEAAEARKNSVELEKELLDQQAHFCRAELVKFIRTKRYAYNPRNLANALAGLPDMSCRRSAARCAKRAYHWGPNMIYRVFVLIERAWRRGGSRSRKSPLPLFQGAIAKLPKTLLVKLEGENKRKRIRNPFRQHLEENWAHLKPAIEDGVRLSKHPGQIPYLITAKFQENRTRPQTQADILFAEQGRPPPT